VLTLGERVGVVEARDEQDLLDAESLQAMQLARLGIQRLDERLEVGAGCRRFGDRAILLLVPRRGRPAGAAVSPFAATRH
jgi:hypothetical protein